MIREAGGPEVLKLERTPVPKPEPGQVLIRVKAFGLNRSELFTRQGHSPSVRFPRVLGIEAVGLVEESPDGAFQEDEVVATAMGGMGRMFDGGYAEYTCVPASQVQSLTTRLDWATLGAAPEMLQTAWGSLSAALSLQEGETLLIRGGTSSVGLAAAAIARKQGAKVAATTRKPKRETLLKDNGAEQVFIDSGEIAETVRAAYSGGVDKVLELVGTTTLLDSLRAARRGGIVCMTGIVGGQWTLESFSPMTAIPTGVCLTSYSGGAEDFMRTPLQALVEQIEAGTLSIAIGRTFGLSEIVEAHRCMEADEAGGKIVVLTEG